MDILFRIFWSLFPILVLFAVKFLMSTSSKLQQLRLKSIDIVTFFMAFGLHELSSLTFNRSIFPFWLIMAMLLAIGSGIYFVYYKKDFELNKVLKIFWRLTFLVTTVLYIVFVILSFVML